MRKPTSSNIKKRTRTRKRNNSYKRIKFLPTSKLIGYVVFIISLLVVVFGCYEMHINQDLSNLGQLFILVGAIVGAYIGFYLTMAKWEHIEEEKTQRQKELLAFKKKNNIEEVEPEEEIERLENEIDKLQNKCDAIEEEEIDVQA